jgi:hypothetical protein
MVPGGVARAMDRTVNNVPKAAGLRAETAAHLGTMRPFGNPFQAGGLKEKAGGKNSPAPHLPFSKFGVGLRD